MAILGTEAQPTFGAPPRRRMLGPVAAALAVVGLAALLFGWTEFESWASRREMERIMRSEGGALLEALGHAVEHALIANREVEELASARLLDISRLTEILEGSGRLDDAGLDRLAADLGLHHLLVVDASGRRIREACPDDPERLPHPSPYEEALGPLLAGRADGLVLGARRAPYGESMRYAAAARREKGGAVLAVMDADKMLAFQSSLGAADLVAAVGATGGIVAAVLEDDEGKVLASTGDGSAPAPGALELERPVEIRFGRTGRLRVSLEAEALAAAGRAARKRSAAAAFTAFALAIAVGGTVAARRRAEFLRREGERARSLTDAVLEGIADAVIVMDPGRVLRLVNPAAGRLFGRAPADLVGLSCEETPICAVEERIPPPGEVREVVFDAADGSRREVLVSSSPVTDERGGEFGTAVVLRDLTETKRLEREAQRTESLAALGRLAASVAHEVRNPLNAIAVGVQRLDKEFLERTGDGEARRLAGVLRDEISRLDGIVGRFLDLARRPRLDPREGDLDTATADLLPFVSSGLPPGVRVSTSLGGASGVVFDAAALKQILHNLVRNAAEAMESGGAILVSTLVEGRSALLEVADEGSGIPARNLDRIFEFGFTTKPGGNGLGLPIVHRLATEMGGSVAVRSEAGKGTIVSVRLPLAAGAIRTEGGQHAL